MPVGGLLPWVVLTRSGVAKRLGRSIATVRRLEGRELFPVVDARGVHRFPDDQVHRLQARLRAGDRLSGARGDWLLGGKPMKLRRPSRHELSIDSERAAAQRDVALTIIELLDRRQLRRLGPDLTDYLESLLHT